MLDSIAKEKINRELALSYCRKYLSMVSSSKHLHIKDKSGWNKLVAKIVFFGAISDTKDGEALEHFNDKQKLFNEEDLKEILEVAPFLATEST